MRIRRATPSDIPLMVELALQTPSAAHWTNEQYERRLATQNQEASTSLVLIAEDKLAGPEDGSVSLAVTGFLVARQLDTEWELENIVVAEKIRQRGVGYRLGHELIEQVKRTGGGTIFLEVRESNHSARSLYNKLGFCETARRKRYYSNPVEDAILYSIIL